MAAYRRCIGTAIVLVGLGATHAAAQPVVTLSEAGGGVRGFRQAPGDLWVVPTQQLNFFVVVRDGSGAPIPNLTIHLLGYTTYAGDGGHIHGGQTPSTFGSFSPSSGSTGATGGGFAMTYSAGAAAGTVTPYLQFTWQGETFQLHPQNGIRVAEEQSDYPFFGSAGEYFLVGSTGTHPNNHYAKPQFIGLLHQLAEMYYFRWGRRLAFNDASLPRGGRFDINGNYAPPHAEHNIGESQDVRANENFAAIPHDPEIREWFENTVRSMFAGSMILESVGTSNEHYHIRM